MSTRELVKEIERSTKKTALLQSKLLNRHVDDRSTDRHARILQLTAGALKRKIKTEPVAWQRKVRKEWGR